LNPQQYAAPVFIFLRAPGYIDPNLRNNPKLDHVV